MSDEGFDGDHQSAVPITAAQARSKTAKNLHKHSASGSINYTLTIRRLYKIIENASENGADSLTFKAPSFVLDGCLGDPIVLARQLKARLIELGYRVRREDATLLISWSQEKQGPSLKSLSSRRK